MKDADYVISINKVLAVTVPDSPGGLAKVIHVLGSNGVNVEYMYGFTAQKKGMANMIFRVEDNQKAIDALMKEGIRPVCQEELENL